MTGATERATALFGREIDDATWAQLIGVPDGGTVDVLPWPDIGSRHGIQLRAHHPWYTGPALRYVFENVDGKRAILNDTFWVREDAPPGVAVRVFAHQVRAAQALGVAYILAEAAGSPSSTMNGYYTWARLGFDGPLPPSVQKRLPAEFAEAEHVLDLIVRPGGAPWWRANGRTFRGTFDLVEPSRSLAVLRDYTVEKGIVI